MDLAGSVAKAFEGSGEGPVFTASLRRAIIRDAVEMVLTPPKDREQKKQTVFRKEFKDGSQAVQTLLNNRARQKPPRSTKAKDKDNKGTPAALNHWNCTCPSLSCFFLWLIGFSEGKLGICLAAHAAASCIL